MKHSLIICTRDRAAQLGPCLDAVSAMEKPEGFELVLVDNGSSDETALVIAKYAEQANFPVQTISEPIAGLGRARNAGWRAAHGNLLSFTDDDCYVAPDYCVAMQRRFEQEPDLGYFGGRILLHDPDDLPITILTITHDRRFRAGAFVKPGSVQGANFGMRRAAMEQAGGFDERLGAGTAFPSEDIEMVGRISAHGWRGMYFPDVIVSHHHGRRSKAEKHKLYAGYERGAGAYFALMTRNKRMRLGALNAFLRRAIRRLPHRTFNEITAFREFNRLHPPE